MKMRQIAPVENSRPTLPPPPTVSSARFLEAVCDQGDCLQLRPQQRVPLPPEDEVIVLRDGILAIDAMPEKGKLQVLDFLGAGDIVSASAVLPTPGVSLRAITSTSLVSLDPPAADRALPTYHYWNFLIARCVNQLARVNIHQLMIGRLETEPRVASFILGLALRSIRNDTSEVTVELPMSRTDIANYLVINCDTLSRTMMRFCDCGLIERKSRHAIRVVDIDALRKKSPLASLLSAVFENGSSRSAASFARYTERSAPSPFAHEHRYVIPPVAATGPFLPSGIMHPYALRDR